MRLRFAPLAAAALALLASSRAEAAYDVLADPCYAHPLTCGTGPVSFDMIDALPIEWGFDTGWVPQGSPLQVHLWADVWANTHVSLAGSLQSSWPTAMLVEAPGKSEGGTFGFHYGADFGAQGKISIKVLGKTYSWQGDLPYVPQFDLQVKADKVFHAWAYDPGVTISGKTPPQQMAQVSIGDIVGGSIPGIDGGFELDVAVELAATYVTDRVVVTTPDGQPVSGGPITSDDGTTSASFIDGPSIELDVHPEGRVHYDGVVHLIPAFYVSLLGFDWNIPIVDIPIGFPITETDWNFEPQRVHFPLPELSLGVAEIDFGVVEVGDSVSLTYEMSNVGEALVAAGIASSDDEVFPLLQTSVAIDPGMTAPAIVSFVPKEAGAFSGLITLLSNDPGSPTQTILLKGLATTADLPDTPKPEDGTVGGETISDVAEDGTCGCRVAGGERGDARWMGLMVIAAAMIARRRRRVA